MKRLLLIVMFILFTSIVIHSDDYKSKQFEVTFTIKYNSITLEQAAKLEKQIKEQFKDACDIDISLSNVEYFRADSTGFTITPSVGRWMVLPFNNQQLPINTIRFDSTGHNCIF